MRSRCYIICSSIYSLNLEIHVMNDLDRLRQEIIELNKRIVFLSESQIDINDFLIKVSKIVEEHDILLKGKEE